MNNQCQGSNVVVGIDSRHQQNNALKHPPQKKNNKKTCYNIAEISDNNSECKCRFLSVSLLLVFICRERKFRVLHLQQKNLINLLFSCWNQQFVFLEPTPNIECSTNLFFLDTNLFFFFWTLTCNFSWQSQKKTFGQKINLFWWFCC